MISLPVGCQLDSRDTLEAEPEKYCQVLVWDWGLGPEINELAKLNDWLDVEPTETLSIPQASSLAA